MSEQTVRAARKKGNRDEQPDVEYPKYDTNRDGVISGQELVDYATQQRFLDTPYIPHHTLANWGPGNGWDCSSYTSFVFRKFGIDLPAYSDTQFGMGTAVEKDDLQPGDLLFFHTDPAKVTGHVGIYVGGGKMVEAANPTAGTRVAGIDWSTYKGARRILKTDGKAQAPEASAQAHASDYDDPNDERETRAGGKKNEIDTPPEVAARYGYTYAFMSANPKLKKWFDSFAERYIAADGNIPESTFRMEFNQIPIVKNHDQSWLEDWRLEHENPEVYKQKLDGTMDTMRDAAAKMGAVVDEGTLRGLAKQAQRWGYSPTQITDQLVGYVHANNGTYIGQAGVNANTLKTWALNNGITLNDSQIDGYVKGIAGGDSDLESIKQDLRNTYMSGAYPAWADKIAAGQDIHDIAAPYKAEMARILGLSPLQINLDDPLLQRGLSNVDDQGRPTYTPMSAFTVMARKDKRWMEGADAGNTIASAWNDVARIWGMAGMGG